MQIDIIYDPVCPWCYIGKRRLEQALRLRPSVEATTRWRPFLLNPKMPPDGIDRTAYLMNKFGSESRVRRTYGAIAEAGQSVEIDFAFERIGQMPNSVNSHRLVYFADRQDKADAAVENLFLAYFVNGQNIGNIKVLLNIGRYLGLDVGALAPISIAIPMSPRSTTRTPVPSAWASTASRPSSSTVSSPFRAARLPMFWPGASTRPAWPGNPLPAKENLRGNSDRSC